MVNKYKLLTVTNRWQIYIHLQAGDNGRKKDKVMKSTEVQNPWHAIAIIYDCAVAILCLWTIFHVGHVHAIGGVTTKSR